MYKFNIIIPSITTDVRLLRCLDGIQKLKYKNFFVTIVLDNKKNTSKLKKFKFKINILVTKNINMSQKRNFAAKKYNSDFLAFIDSDASPCKGWLNYAVKEIKSKGVKVVGGPNLPFKNQSFWEKITYYCKRSFFVTAHYNFINFKSKSRYCKFLHSSNFIISKKLYSSVKGMDENLYIGEDHDLFYRLNEKFKKLKIYFSKDIFVFHEDREFKFFLMQRFCYGLNVLTSNNTATKRFLAFIPFFLICTIFFFLFNSLKISLTIFFLFFILLSIFIFLEISVYIKQFATRLLTIICIYLSNFFYGMGTFMYFFGLRKSIEKVIYRNIKKEI
tara:strand:+ start:189 stop:1181 length:993 start_codon:yes stop_codon:yes gene_type:complete